MEKLVAMQILVVEDDKRISNFLIKGLEESGYLVTCCSNAEEVLTEYVGIQWDLIILDIMLPGMDGVQLLQTLRYRQVYVPILMLSALNGIPDKITALDYGADDYLTKPFHFDELLSRIKALTRRQQYQQNEAPKSELQIGSLLIKFEQYQVFLAGEELDLSPREYKLLSYLVRNINKTVTRVQILNAVWGITFDNHSNVVDVYVSYLRHKIEKGGDKYIFTVKGVGYIFKAQ
ncbi:MAG: response regulator transcription factor [Sphingobacterium sp.]